MTHPSEMTVRTARQAIKSGQLTSESLVRAYAERIEERDVDVKAWAYFNTDQAIAAAQASDKAGNKVRLAVSLSALRILSTPSICRPNTAHPFSKAISHHRTQPVLL